MIQGDFSLYVLIFPALPDLPVWSRLMTISTLKTLNPVENTEGSKTMGLKLTSFSLKHKLHNVVKSQSHMLQYK